MVARGQAVKITLKDTDGEFIFYYGKKNIHVRADLPDISGRGGEGMAGILYYEPYGDAPELDDVVVGDK